MSAILVTGAAGFIGFHVSKRLLQDGRAVIGVDSLSDYYDVQLKMDRLEQLKECSAFRFSKMDLADREACEKLFGANDIVEVIHLAAQAGVRYSLVNPHAYVDSNLVSFVNVLEGCRHRNVSHLVYASSSSVYGANKNLPYSVQDNVDHPVSLYAATKKANELMAHTYSHLFGLPTTGLRFFTVYGPWGRPDMALYRFTRAILAGEAIDVYNHGRMRRDFSYVDDVVEGIVRTVQRIPKALRDGSVDETDPSCSQAPYRVYNIGNHQPVELIEFITILEQSLGRKAKRNMLPLQPGDVLETFANVDELMQDVGYRPSTPLDVGLRRFVDWYLNYHGVDLPSS